MWINTEGTIDWLYWLTYWSGLCWNIDQYIDLHYADVLIYIILYWSIYWPLLCIDNIVEHWQQTASTLADTRSPSATECDRVDRFHAGDIDMTEIKSENKRKLATMSEDEILARQKELTSALGKFTVTAVFCM